MCLGGYVQKSAEFIVRNESKDFFVAIVDLELPDAAKGEAVDLVIEHEIPALVFTGNYNLQSQESFWSKGIADYVRKNSAYSLQYIKRIVKRIYLNRNSKVLVVDDSSAIRQTTAYILGLQRYHVLTAQSGHEALELLREHPDIKVCLLDCYMDGLSGMETAIKMRQTHSRDELEIIGMSSANDHYMSANFIKSGANDFLIKPFLPDELLCRVNHAAERKRALVN